MNDADTPAQRLQKSWGVNLRAEREAQGLRQVDLAAKASLDQTTLSAYENGKRAWTAEILLTFAVALDTTVPRLFPWPEYIEQAERLRRDGFVPAPVPEPSEPKRVA